MAALLPNRFLFRFEFPLHRWAGPVRIDADLNKWKPRYELPALHALDDQAGFGRVWMAWRDDGLLVACRVAGKRRPLACDTLQLKKSDHLRLMTDMRDARDIRRATRFCQQLYFMPRGGPKGAAAAGSERIVRAKEDAPPVRPGAIAVAAQVTASGPSGGGYALEAFVPKEALVGFDPAENSRIGLYYILEDRELGHQCLTIDDDLNWWMDPSTWATAVLTE